MQALKYEQNYVRLSHQVDMFSKMDSVVTIVLDVENIDPNLIYLMFWGSCWGVYGCFSSFTSVGGHGRIMCVDFAVHSACACIFVVHVAFTFRKIGTAYTTACC